jgi:tRNA dimethylallyltransferase
MMERVVAMVGSTGVGKTDLAIAAGRELAGEIVSVDSRLLYRGMDIGTAKPSPAQRAAVPHHLIDVADPDEAWSLGRFRQAVLDTVQGILGRRRVPILVGGSGQYMTAILDGWSPPAWPPDAGIRRKWAEFTSAHGAPALHAQLRAVDPAAAERIDSRNVRRVIRALEVYELSGGPGSRQPARANVPFEAIRIGLRLPRPELYVRLDARLERMLADGLVEEVRSLRAGGYGRDLPSMSAIGYRQIAAYLDGEISLEQAVAQVRQATRRFVRHQANWFRADDHRWSWFEPRPGYEADVLAYLASVLAMSRVSKS